MLIFRRIYLSFLGLETSAQKSVPMYKHTASTSLRAIVSWLIAYLRALGELAAWVQSEGGDEKVTTKLRRKARRVAAVSEKLNNRVRKILQQG